MTKIYQVSGTETGNSALGCPAPGEQKLFTIMGYELGELSEGHMDVLCARDNMVSKRDIAASKIGIGDLRTQKFQNSIDVFDDALHGLDHSEDPVAFMGAIEEAILAGEYSLQHEVSGIASPALIKEIRDRHQHTRRQRLHAKVASEMISGIGKAKKSSNPKGKTGGFLKRAAQKTGKALKKAGGAIKKTTKKAGAALKKAAGKVLKVVTTPTRLIVKGILEITLPKAAPFFIYLFINDPALIAKLPQKVAAKRAKSVKIKNFIVNIIGMKDAHFMSIVRNGIMKLMGASPETVLSKRMGTTVSGVGAADPYTAAIMFVIDLIGKLGKAFKKDKGDTPDVTADDAPSDDDFEGLNDTEKKDLGAAIKMQNDLPEPGETKDTVVKDASTNDAPLMMPKAANGSDQKNPDVDTAPEDPKKNKSVEQSTDGSTETSTAAPADEPTAPATTNETDSSGEIKKPAAFETGGRKGWDSTKPSQ